MGAVAISVTACGSNGVDADANADDELATAREEPLADAAKDPLVGSWVNPNPRGRGWLEAIFEIDASGKRTYTVKWFEPDTIPDGDIIHSVSDSWQTFKSTSGTRYLTLHDDNGDKHWYRYARDKMGMHFELLKEEGGLLGSPAKTMIVPQDHCQLSTWDCSSQREPRACENRCDNPTSTRTDERDAWATEVR